MYDQDPNQFSGNYVDENAKDFSGVHYGKFEAHCMVRRWRGMAYLGVFRRTQFKHCKASSEI